jgi:hypothetical protein
MVVAQQRTSLNYKNLVERGRGRWALAVSPITGEELQVKFLEAFC